MSLWMIVNKWVSENKNTTYRKITLFNPRVTLPYQPPGLYMPLVSWLNENDHSIDECVLADSSMLIENDHSIDECVLADNNIE